MTKHKDKKHFAFRLDADARIGTGHLMRCLSIADELIYNSNVSCHFLCKKLISPLQKWITKRGHLVYTVDHEDSALDTLAEIRPEGLIIDHYELGAKFESNASAFCKYILVIDDLANRHHRCDYLLDQGPLRNPDDYRPWVNRDCQLLLGLAYTLIRPEFRKFRKSKITSWSKGLICFGGVDPNNITLAVLKALAAKTQKEEIKWLVVAGAANPYWQALKHFADKVQFKFKLIKQSDQIAKLMAKHDFAIGAAGTMAWERACVGLPTLAIPIADNQSFGIEVIKHFGLGETLRVSEITPALLEHTLKRLRQNANIYLERNQTMIDGLGISRLMQILKRKYASN